MTLESPWIGAPVLAPMDRLLPVALAAIENEEKVLETALSTRRGLRTTAEGLLDHLYETTLAYLVFRAWLPIADVVWEAEYDKRRCDLAVEQAEYGNKRRCDLAVEHEGRTSHVELKWWLSMRAGALRSLRKDVDRVRSSTGAGYLLCFWWNYEAANAWDEDRQSFIDTAKDLDADPVYASRFVARVSRGSEIVPGYFAMAGFRARS